MSSHRGSLQRPSVRAIATLTAAAVAGVLALCAGSASAAITTIGGPGVGAGSFEVPGADALDGSGNLYVLDAHRGTLREVHQHRRVPRKLEEVGGASLPKETSAGSRSR